MSILNLSKVINSIDENVITYNGSLLPIDEKRAIVAYRATQKPKTIGVDKKYLPEYPYQQLHGSLWYNSCNYVGLAILDMSKSLPEVLSVSKYVHTIQEGYTNQELYDMLSKENPGSSFKSLLAGPEDPRLYYKEEQKEGKDDMELDRKIYMNYNQSFIHPLGGCKSMCVSMFEIEIKISEMHNKIYPELGKKLICEKVDDGSGHVKNLFDTTNQVTIKNWSYSPSFFIDSYKDKAFLYQLKQYNDPSECVKSRYSSVMSPFIQDDWGVALTTPTVKYEENFYGVAHIRVKWSSISQKLDMCSDGIKNIIKKSDVHHNDFYFMSVYKIENNVWSMTKPFLATGIATGELTDKYYSYNVNFPCGFFISSKRCNITFGLGDCILMYLKVKLKDLSFLRAKFNYNDLKIVDIKDQMLKKKYVNSKLCCNRVKNLSRFLLPRYVRLFDLGGGGLKSRIYHSISDSFSEEINFGRDSVGLSPDKIIRKFDNNFNININNEYLNGWGFAFSLAGLDKLWTANIGENMASQLPSDIRVKFGLENNNKVVYMKDSESHIHGSFYKLQQKGYDITDINILNIAIGTGINISFSQRGKIKQYHKSISQPMDKSKKEYFWDIKLMHNGKRRSIRSVLIDRNLTREQFNKIIGVFLRFQDNDINMSGLWPTSWESPQIITITGGGSNFLIDKIPNGHINLRYSNNEGEGWGRGTFISIYNFPDPELPYRGLMWKFMKETCRSVNLHFP